MRLTFWPGLCAALTLAITNAAASTIDDIDQVRARVFAQHEARQTAERERKDAQDKARHAFSAQVVGLEWLDPLQRRDYPTEWQLLWTLGLSKPNKNDEVVKEEPAKFSKVQPVAGFADGSTSEPVDAVFRLHIENIGLKLRQRYFTNDKYFYTVQPRNSRDWRELAGIRIDIAVPDRVQAQPAQAFVRKEYVNSFSIGKTEQNLSTSSAPPDVHMTQGGASAGFTSLADALDYLEAHPDKTVWVMSFDAPTYPVKADQMNESSVLLILAHPSYKTEREPLAWLHRVSTRKMQDYEAKAGHSPRIVQAWSAAVTDAAGRGGVPVMQIGQVIHDAGMGSQASSDRIGTLGQALTETLPEFNFLKQTFNTTALLGDLGASSALTNIALGIAYAHHKNVPVIVAGTGEADTATALLIRPPAHPKPFDPDKTWFRARSESNAYLPWWGRRLDEKRNLLQGWSE